MTNPEPSPAAAALWAALASELVPGAVVALAACNNEAYTRFLPLLRDAARAYGVPVTHLTALGPGEPPVTYGTTELLAQAAEQRAGGSPLVLAAWAALPLLAPALADAARRHRLCVLLLGDVDLDGGEHPRWADLPAEIADVARTAFVLSSPRYHDHVSEEEEIPRHFLTDVYRLGSERQAVLQLRLITPTVDARMPTDVA
jgi:hypothetical protein